MRKKSARHTRRQNKATQGHGNYVVVVRSWMFVVAFALMLGLGAVLGGYFRLQLDASTPTVAGVSIEAR